LPEVNSISVDDQALTIITSNFCLTEINPESRKRQFFNIGCFSVRIFFDSSRFGIARITNITGKGTGNNYNLHHPHIDGEGKPCWGNIAETVAYLSAGYQFGALADLIIQFLKSVNINDQAGRYLFRCWPEINQKEFEKHMGPV
jgi:hypothetical protein